jgi:hypothetical protein
MSQRKFERKELHIEERIACALESIVDVLEQLVPRIPIPASIQMTQGDTTMGFAILPSATGTFGLTLSPAGSAFPLAAVITWTADNSTDVSAPSLSTATAASPAGLTAAVTSGSAPVATSFNLTASATFTDPVSGNSVTLTTGPNPVGLGTGVVTTSPVPTSISMTQIS